MIRRRFLESITAASAGIAFSSFASFRKPKVLVLGGRYFVGPAVVSSLISEGYDVTLFNRGKTNPDLFPDLKIIKGDRSIGADAYAAVQDEYDVIVDVWPEKSYMVDHSTRALQELSGRYVFISSIAVYNNWQEVGIHEDSDTLALPEDTSTWSYGEEKLAAEQMVRDRFKDHLILRPGPITGWRDPALDLLYWIVRLQKNLEVLGPGSGNDPLQFVDVKDVGAFTALGLRNRLSGTFNLTGPGSRMNWKQFLEKTSNHLGSRSIIHYPEEVFLSDNGVRSFEDLPLWAPLSEDRGFMQISAAKALKSGFRFRDTNATVDDRLKWFVRSSIDLALPEIGLNRSKELELISLLK